MMAIENWTARQWEESRTLPASVFYLYTPLCGTCAVASKMIEVIAAMRPGLPIGKADMNYTEELAETYSIESVPCLLIQKNGELTHKVYAFGSVPDLLEKID